MKIGVIGLGNMGSAIAQRLVDAGYAVIGYDANPETAQKACENGVQLVNQPQEVAEHARVVWLSLPAGKIIDDVIAQMQPMLKKGDIVIDAGNSHFADSKRRALCLESQGFNFLDCGLSGGLQGRGLGFCLMIGGDHDSYTKIQSVLAAVAFPGGVAHVGSSGAGHYVKMVHNAIEYGLLEAYAEGLQLLREGSFSKELDLPEITNLWNHGSIIRSWLLELSHRVIEHDEELTSISGVVNYGETALWASQEAKEHSIPVPVINDSIKVRKESQKTGGNYATKLIALLRHEFGGHPFKKKENK